MQEIKEFFERLFETSSWPPRWYCGEWTDFHGWLYIISDIAIWLAYFAIPLIIVWFVRKRPDVPFLPVFWLFSAFILLCGATHMLDAIIFWWPAYRLSALTRFVTAIVSITTAYALVRDLPKALSLKSPEAEALAVSSKNKIEEDLKEQNDLMERLINEMERKNQEIIELKETISVLRSTNDQNL